MDKKDFILRAFKCMMGDKRVKPNIECLICPYGKDLDFSDGDDIESIKCNQEKLKADIAKLIEASK